jgi:hypothetical protein
MTDTSKFEAPLKDEETVQRVMSRPGTGEIAAELLNAAVRDTGVDWKPQDVPAKGPTILERLVALEAEDPKLHARIDELSAQVADLKRLLGV